MRIATLVLGLFGFAAFELCACSLVESFDGYSDDYGRAGAGAAPSGGGPSGGGAPSGGAGGVPSTGGWAGTAGSAGVGGTTAGGGGAPPLCDAGTDCGGTCVDTSTNADHCGGCGVRCADSLGPLSACVASSCVCNAGTTKCGGKCTRLESDPLNCGACGVVVDAAEYCVGGKPACRPGTEICKVWTYNGNPVTCYTKCTDTKGDGSHCIGSNGLQSRCYLGSTVTGRCVDGDCTSSPCPSNLMECAGSPTLSNVKSCFDPKRDANHCGKCFNQCAPGQTCAQGACVAYQVVQSCSECAAGATCCEPTPATWAHAKICVAGGSCPI